MLSIGLPCNSEYFLCVYCIVPRLPRSAWSPRVIQSPSFTRNLGQLQAPGFSAPPLLGDFSPAWSCLLRPGEQRRNYRGGVGGELPAPALRLAVSPSFRGGPGLDREGVTCQPVRWGRQRWAKGRDDTFPQAPSAARGEVSQPRRQRGSHRLTGGSEGPGRVWSRRGPSPLRRR